MPWPEPGTGLNGCCDNVLVAIHPSLKTRRDCGANVQDGRGIGAILKSI
jgi:hypothetical protein